MPNEPFEKVFKRVGLLGRQKVLPTQNPDSEGWNSAMSRVRDNLSTFSNVRGGRMRSSSFVVKSRSARQSLNHDRPPLTLCVTLACLLIFLDTHRSFSFRASLLTMAPTLMAGTVAAHGWVQPGSLSDPAHSDPSRSSAALWEGKLQLHPDTSPDDPAYQRFGGGSNASNAV